MPELPSELSVPSVLLLPSDEELLPWEDPALLPSEEELLLSWEDPVLLPCEEELSPWEDPVLLLQILFGCHIQIDRRCFDNCADPASGL